jgi:hypothetical protein
MLSSFTGAVARSVKPFLKELVLEEVEVEHTGGDWRVAGWTDEQEEDAEEQEQELDKAEPLSAAPQADQLVGEVPAHELHSGAQLSPPVSEDVSSRPPEHDTQSSLALERFGSGAFESVNLDDDHGALESEPSSAQVPVSAGREPAATLPPPPIDQHKQARNQHPVEPSQLQQHQNWPWQQDWSPTYASPPLEAGPLEEPPCPPPQQQMRQQPQQQQQQAQQQQPSVVSTSASSASFFGRTLVGHLDKLRKLASAPDSGSEEQQQQQQQQGEQEAPTLQHQQLYQPPQQPQQQQQRLVEAIARGLGQLSPEELSELDLAAAAVWRTCDTSSVRVSVPAELPQTVESLVSVTSGKLDEWDAAVRKAWLERRSAVALAGDAGGSGTLATGPGPDPGPGPVAGGPVTSGSVAGLLASLAGLQQVSEEQDAALLDLEGQEAELREREASVEQRARAVAEEAVALASRAAAVAADEQRCAAARAAVAQREEQAALGAAQRAQALRELGHREQQLAQAEAAQRTALAALEERERAADSRREAVRERETALGRREAMLVQAEQRAELARREREAALAVRQEQTRGLPREAELAELHALRARVAQLEALCSALAPRAARCDASEEERLGDERRELLAAALSSAAAQLRRDAAAAAAQLRRDADADAAGAGAERERERELGRGADDLLAALEGKAPEPELEARAALRALALQQALVASLEQTVAGLKHELAIRAGTDTCDGAPAGGPHCAGLGSTGVLVQDAERCITELAELFLPAPPTDLGAAARQLAARLERADLVDTVAGGDATDAHAAIVTALRTAVAGTGSTGSTGNGNSSDSNYPRVLLLVKECAAAVGARRVAQDAAQQRFQRAAAAALRLAAHALDSEQPKEPAYIGVAKALLDEIGPVPAPPVEVPAQARTVDQKLAASVVAKCVERNCRLDCLEVVARVLDFDADERRRVGLDKPQGFWGGLFGTELSRGQARAQSADLADKHFSDLLGDFVQDEIS